MTAASLAAIIGCTGIWHTGNLNIQVQIIDARQHWNVDYLVAPVAGSGQQWVSATKVTDLATPAVTP